MGVEVPNVDLWPNISAGVIDGTAGAAGGSLIDSIFGSLSGNPLGWLNAGSSLLGVLGGGRKIKQSAAAGAAESQLNTSGWVVGEGDADGGTLERSNGVSAPWYVWVAGTVLIVAVIKRGA